MENLVGPLQAFWKGRSVFLTGHTGFKGAWLALWLNHLGAKVHGYALDPAGQPNLFDMLQLQNHLLTDTRADLSDRKALSQAISTAQPDVIFHLAAQSLVRQSYLDPVDTFQANIMGTVNVLEAVRHTDCVRAMVVVTTDKVYENAEQGQAFAESDPLGGHDPYSGSKAAAEIVTACYRKSFFMNGGMANTRVATARAGNVIGGGDWSSDRLVPDCIRAFSNGKPVYLRYPAAVRPWQHVLESLSGYLGLAQALASPGGEAFARPWNFGPDDNSSATVGEVARQLATLWGHAAEVVEEHNSSLHEAGLLRLDSQQAKNALHWRPRWNLANTLQQTVAWYQANSNGRDMPSFTLEQIRQYEAIHS